MASIILEMSSWYVDSVESINQSTFNVTAIMEVAHFVEGRALPELPYLRM